MFTWLYASVFIAFEIAIVAFVVIAVTNRAIVERARTDRAVEHRSADLGYDSGRLAAMLSLRRQGFNPKTEVAIIRPGHQFTDASVWKCGARIGRINATIPGALVTFDREWLRVEEVPTYDVWVDRSRVLAIQAVRFLWSSGIRFVTEDGRYDGLIIWTPAGMTGALRSAGW